MAELGHSFSPPPVGGQYYSVCMPVLRLAPSLVCTEGEKANGITFHCWPWIPHCWPYHWIGH